MAKPNILHFMLLAGSMLSSGLAYAYDYNSARPGEKGSRLSPKPYAVIEQNPNISNFMTPVPIQKETKDIYFSANNIENNRTLETITATGDVNIIRNGLTLNADKVIYNQRDDIVTAVGNVRMIDSDNNVIFSDYIVLSNKMSQGEMDNIKIILRDESRISARRIRTLNNHNKIMNNAVYSPCDVCTTNPNPLWQLNTFTLFCEIKGQS